MGIFSAFFNRLEPMHGAEERGYIGKFDEIYTPSADYTVVDLETSGLDPCKSDILEIGAIKYRNHTQVAEFQTFVHPTGRIPREASSVNNIYWRDVSTAPNLQTIMPRFMEFLGDDIILGYNIGFDIRFLQTRSQQTISNFVFDVLKFARQVFPNMERYRLDDMREHFHISGGAHRAIDDCNATAQIYQLGLQTADGQRFAADAVPLSKIVKKRKELADWNVWLENGQMFYTSGETARKEGRFEEAIQYFEKAKNCACVYPFLYDSYAMIYRKQRDYKNEIKILEEGILRLGEEVGKSLVERKEKAVRLLASKEAAEQIEQERALRREARAARKLQQQLEEKSKPRQPQKRPVVQMDDSGVVIREFISIAEAAKEVGTDPKNIRSAASGAQKHAAGFCWAYKQNISEFDS